MPVAIAVNRYLNNLCIKKTYFVFIVLFKINIHNLHLTYLCCLDRAACKSEDESLFDGF